MRELIVYQCNECKKYTILFASEVTHTEQEAMYLSCGHDGRHKLGMIVCRKYADMKECREQKFSVLI